MAITPPPIAPNTGNPAQLEERADAFFGWFATFVADFNNDLPLLRGKTWATRGGSANAITLTAGLVSLTVGTQVRFRAAAANTGAVTINLDGLGAVACRTITGVALPAGYIRTDVETVATYDGTFWVLDRKIERGANANGEFARFADGTQIAGLTVSVPGTTTATGSMFVSEEISSVLPASFVGLTRGSGSALTGNNQWVNARVSGNNDVVFVRLFGTVSNVVSRTVDVLIMGRWY